MDNFVLEGFGKPMVGYPAPVVAVGRLDGARVTIFPGEKELFDPIPENTDFVHLSNEQLEDLRDFDPKIHLLFAYSELDVVYRYAPKYVL